MYTLQCRVHPLHIHSVIHPLQSTSHSHSTLQITSTQPLSTSTLQKLHQYHASLHYIYKHMPHTHKAYYMPDLHTTKHPHTIYHHIPTYPHIPTHTTHILHIYHTHTTNITTHIPHTHSHTYHQHISHIFLHIPRTYPHIIPPLTPTFFPPPSDAPLCSSSTTGVYRVALGDEITLPCRVLAHPPNVTFSWTFMNSLTEVR